MSDAEDGSPEDNCEIDWSGIVVSSPLTIDADWRDQIESYMPADMGGIMPKPPGFSCRPNLGLGLLGMMTAKTKTVARLYCVGVSPHLLYRFRAMPTSPAIGIAQLG